VQLRVYFVIELPPSVEGLRQKNWIWPAEHWGHTSVIGGVGAVAMAVGAF
jgi:hypothetical protein